MNMIVQSEGITMYENIIDKMKELKLETVWPGSMNDRIRAETINETVEKCIGILKQEEPIEVGDIITSDILPNKHIIIGINNEEGFVNCIDKDGNWRSVAMDRVNKTGDKIAYWSLILKRLV